MESLEGIKSSLLTTVKEQCSHFDRVLREELAKRRLTLGFRYSLLSPRLGFAKLGIQLNSYMQ